MENYTETDLQESNCEYFKIKLINPHQETPKLTKYIHNKIEEEETQSKENMVWGNIGHKK